MREERVCTSLYAVDDERFTVHLWVAYKEDEVFPGVSFCRSNRMEDAVAYARKTSEPTLYVLDSRIDISSELFQECSVITESECGVDIKQLAMEDREMLGGVFVAVLLRTQHPQSRVVLLTAFLNELRKIESALKLMEYGCDDTCPKIDEKSVYRAVRKLLALSREG